MGRPQAHRSSSAPPASSGLISLWLSSIPAMSVAAWFSRVQSLPSSSKLTELSAHTRFTRPSSPLWMYFSTSYAIGWNRVHTALP